MAKTRRQEQTEHRVTNTFDEDSDIVPASSKSRDDWKFSVEKYNADVSVTIVREDDKGMLLEFDLIGCKAPIANAIRRVLLAEVPTMAFDRVYLYQNTTVLPDEVLCHRIGLVPLAIDPRAFKWPSKETLPRIEMNTDLDKEATPAEDEACVFELKVECKLKKDAPPGAITAEERCDNAIVETSHLEWIPIGEQRATFENRPPAPVHDNIVLVKMHPILRSKSGMEIEARCHAVKGIGRDHAKFSPVATASYRLLPEITFKRRFVNEEAERVKECFSEGVVQLVKREDGTREAVVANARADMGSRNIFRYPALAKDVSMAFVKDHYIFSIESTGALSSFELLIEACEVLEAKCRYLKDEIMKASEKKSDEKAEEEIIMEE